MRLINLIYNITNLLLLQSAFHLVYSITAEILEFLSTDTYKDQIANSNLKMDHLTGIFNQILQETSNEDTVQSYPPFRVLTIAFTTVFVGALGDKTFFISALMATRFNKLMVMLGASFALFIILGLSAAIGSAVPNLISQSTTTLIITVLFFVIGCKLVYDGVNFKEQSGTGDRHTAEVEMKGIEEKLLKKNMRGLAKHPEIDLLDTEKNSHFDTERNHFDTYKTPHFDPYKTPHFDSYVTPQFDAHMTPKLYIHTLNVSTNRLSSTSPELPAEHNKLYSIVEMNNQGGLKPVPTNKFAFMQAFSLIFFGEWGDRSQIYTVALSSRNPALLVFLGAYAAHMIAILIAVIFGSYIAKRIPEKWLLIAAGSLYLILGIIMLFE